jgi:hypothetical protein
MQTKMKTSAALIALFVALAATGASAQLGDTSSTDVFELHGSGTTNPQKFFWKVMDILEERAADPIKLTYRGVGACPVPSTPINRPRQFLICSGKPLLTSTSSQPQALPPASWISKTATTTSALAISPSRPPTRKMAT